MYNVPYFGSLATKRTAALLWHVTQSDDITKSFSADRQSQVVIYCIYIFFFLSYFFKSVSVKILYYHVRHARIYFKC